LTFTALGESSGMCTQSRQPTTRKFRASNAEISDFTGVTMP
jgi:hypothetical protein